MDESQIRIIYDYLGAEYPCPMNGPDSFAWGQPGNPSSFASDLRQVVNRPNSGLIWKPLQEKIARCALRLPSWLFSILFTSHGYSDRLGYTIVSSSSVERVAIVLVVVLLALTVWLSRFLFDDVVLILFAK